MEKPKNIYKGHRYVPKLMGQWSKLVIYEGLSIVQYQGNSFTSKKSVPVGIDLTNEEYWVVTGNYNAQIENYRQEVADNKLNTNKNAIEILKNTKDIKTTNDSIKTTNDSIKTTNETIDNVSNNLNILDKRTLKTIKATEFFNDIELADIQKIKPLLDHSEKVQKAIDLLNESKIYTLTFPKGNFRLKNLNLKGSTWIIKGVESDLVRKHETKIFVIAGLSNTLFNGKVQFFSMNNIEVQSEGAQDDKNNMSVFNNPSLNGTFVTMKNVLAENFSGSAFTFRDLIDSVFDNVDCNKNDIGIDIISDNPLWDRTTTVTFNKNYSNHNRIAIKANNTGQSSMIDCIFENNIKGFEINDSQFTFINVYLENNEYKSLALRAKLVEINTFVFGANDGIDNKQEGMNPYNDGHMKINHRSINSKEIITEYHKSKNLLLGNDTAERWVLLGEFDREIAGSHIKIQINGSSSWGQSLTLNDMSSQVCETNLIIEVAANGNKEIINTSSFFYHVGNNPAISRFRIEHDNEYRTKIRVYGLVEQYARAMVEIKIQDGWFKWSGQDKNPRPENDGMTNEVTNAKKVIAKDLLFVETDNLRLTTIVENGEVVGTSKKQLPITINGVSYKIPLM